MIHPDSTKRAAAGFSLVELVLVMALVAVLGAIAIPRYAASINRYRADAAARRLVAELEQAQAAARRRSERYSLMLDPADDLLRLRRSAAAAGDPDVARWSLQREPYRARMVSADFGGDAVIVFDGFGRPDSGGSASVQAGDELRTVVVNSATGKASIQ